MERPGAHRERGSATRSEHGRGERPGQHLAHLLGESPDLADPLDRLLAPVLGFLRCRTPDAWLGHAETGVEDLLLDHASLELKAAEQAQKLIRRYGAGRQHGPALPDHAFRVRLVVAMSRLAREELRHFEQVVALIESRGGEYRTVSASRYAAGLHALARNSEPAALVDALVIGAIIEARSCERFYSLVRSARLDDELTRFYHALLRSEARHFDGYLKLAAAVAGDDLDSRIDTLLERDRELILSPDSEFRFHSGVPAADSGHRVR